jgi:hypothetical protein
VVTPSKQHPVQFVPKPVDLTVDLCADENGKPSTSIAV